MWCPSWLLASENNIEQLITEFPVHASKQLSTDHKNSHTVERLSIAQHLSNAELALARIHVAIVQGAFEQANKQLTEVNQRLLSGNELAYFYYLNALNLANQFNGVGAMDYLKRLKVADSPSVLVNPQFSYLLVYARIYFNAHELNLFANTLIQLEALNDDRLNVRQFCQLAILRLQSTIVKNKLKRNSLLHKSTAEKCLNERLGVVAADSYYQLAAVDIALNEMNQQTVQYLEKAAQLYQSQRIVNRFVDAYLLSSEATLISGELSHAASTLQTIEELQENKITLKQQVEFHQLSAQYYQRIGESVKALKALESFVEDKVKLEKNKRTDNVSFLTFRITENRQRLEHAIEQEKQAIKRSWDDEHRYCILLILIGFFALTGVSCIVLIAIRRALR